MDINTIKKYIYSTLTGETTLDPSDIVMVFVVTLILGGYIFWIYKRQTRSEFYSKDFNIILPALSIVTSSIMVAMQANLLVSLGMVGSLSIVRFRTAVKSPMDLLYLFWSISVGIICGVCLYSLAALLCLFVTLILLGLSHLYRINSTTLLVINATEKVKTEEVENIIQKFSTKKSLSSLIKRADDTEYIYELVVSDTNALATNLKKIAEIKSVNIVSNTGERRF